MDEVITTSAMVLDRAKELVNGERRQDYGPPLESINRIAKLWEPILGIYLEPHQIALCLAQLKVARICAGPTVMDSWVDLAGYAAIGAEVTFEGTEENWS